MIEENRLITPQQSVEDKKLETSLRPTSLDDYIGQEVLKKNLYISITAAKKRKESIDHLLLYGMPGLGKTSLAHIIANEVGTTIKITTGPAIDKTGDLAAILTNLQPHDILFIDEIHRLPKTVEEILYTALEDFALDIMIGKGPSARNVRIDLPPFTLIGATTKISMMSSPLRDRFGSVHKLKFYNENELAQIISRSASLLDIAIDDHSSLEIAQRSRRTPRIANRLLKRVRDFCDVHGNGEINLNLTKEALQLLDIDHLGLDTADRNIIKTIIEKYNGGPVGLQTLSASAAEDINAIEQVIEPYLLQIGFLSKTPKGRTVTHHAYKHLNISPPPNNN